MAGIISIPATDFADRLPFCPRCAYPLTGLSHTYHCPECGLTYDTDSRMWSGVRRTSKSERVFRFIMGCIGFSFGIVFILMSRRFSTGGGSAFVWLGVANALIAMINIVGSVRRDVGRNWFLAQLPDGIWYLSQNGKSRSMPWSSIRVADERWTPLGIAFTIRLRPRGVLRVPRDVTPNMDHQDAIARINARIAQSKTT